MTAAGTSSVPLAVALRDNPLRRQLLVSSLLGKHVPVAPSVVRGAAQRLTELVEDAVRAASLEPSEAVVLGFAETATGLSAAVADALGARWDAHSTRYLLPGDVADGAFEEVHSHAPGHHLLAGALPPGRIGALILVDDEVTSGRTVLALARLLLEEHPAPLVVVAALHDSRSAERRAAWDEEAALLAAPVRLVAIHEVPEDFVPSALEGLVGSGAAAPVVLASPAAAIRRIRAEVLPTRSARGSGREDRRRLREAVAELGDRVLQSEGLAELGAEDEILVLGTEEFLRAPQLLAEHLEGRTAARVLTSSTTRSPGLVLDHPAYGLRSGIAVRMDVAGESAALRFAYNLARDPRGLRVVVVCHDESVSPDGDAPDALPASLARSSRVIDVLMAPADEATAGPPPLTGPDFSSYRADDVVWLLTDLSDRALERPREEREDLIQTGRRHYSESLPIEYEPTARYLEAYEHALTRGAGAVAEGVAALGVEIERRHGPHPVLVSLARAGVPIGVLLRRWFLARGNEVPHFAISVIRDRGIDAVALDHVIATAAPESIVFIDGWTGKGVIASTLRAALASHRFPPGGRVAPSLAVLSDPLGVADIRATRDDMLVPSACLNSTVSGLVSRTVLNDELIRPGMFHGAKFYRHLAAVDRSEQFLEVVQARFPAVPPSPATSEPTALGSADAEIERLLRRHGVRDRNLLKPGIGETTRVLLRRVPRQVVVRSDAADSVEHLLVLAADRGVEVVVDEAMPFAAVGIIARAESP
ncbi:phosphoribosyltransferase domain-containing protein [Rathayibacter sp. AY1H3]|uniref:phosphoribosyltransferase domain-containing protein n=1 Tax=Rathayibacter sp. AY1H3 TaxID=2080567 RepID=UPI000CE84D18|nr:phosphoribosyltransferase domain-containing protein [Rathayibacter sp. AY1H3]PPH07758.1 phosphoribosyltransferase [Rathayibacter sp. AY1H3]